MSEKSLVYLQLVKALFVGKWETDTTLLRMEKE